MAGTEGQGELARPKRGRKALSTRHRRPEKGALLGAGFRCAGLKPLGLPLGPQLDASSPRCPKVPSASGRVLG